MSKTEGGDTITMEFTYNHAGLRTKKVKKVNCIVKETTEYILNGKNIVRLIHTNHDTSDVNRLHFYYDAQGRVALVDFNGTLYSYVYNLQGDILITVILYGRMIEIYLYSSIAAIPLATMSNREWGQIGNNYIRGLLALAFQGFFMMICVAIYAVLVSHMTITANIHTALFSVAAYTVLLCFALFKTSSLSKAVFNAH